MNTGWLKFAAVGILGLTMAASSAFAGDRHDWARARHERHEARIARIEHRQHERRAFERHREMRDRHFDRERWRHEHRNNWRDHGRDHRPAGWDRGKKNGWKGGSLPPGQEKKIAENGHWGRH